jgi:broad specificity phosphatase PhoE
MKIHIVRHASTKYNTERKWQGRVDIPLDENGVEQARRLALRFASTVPDRIYSSPLKRALQTAEEIAKVHGLGVEIMNELIEGDLSLWEGLPADQVKTRYRKEYEEWTRNPDADIEGIESVRSVYQRTVKALRKIFEGGGEEVIVVTHAIVVRSAVCYVLKMPLESFREFIVHNASVTTILINDGWWRLYSLNDISHLR